MEALYQLSYSPEGKRHRSARHSGRNAAELIRFCGNPASLSVVKLVVLSMVNRIEHAAKGSGTVTFMTGTEPVTKSYGALHDEAKAMAAVLQARGIDRGDRVALLGPTTENLVTAIQAIWLTGATLVVLPLPMRLASIEQFTEATRARVQRARCAAVLVDGDLAPFVSAAEGDPPMYVLGDLLPTATGATHADFVRPDYHQDDLFVLQFTSGSTSEPKGVMLPNHVVAANVDAIVHNARVDLDTDKLVSWLPLYHDMGLVGFCILPMSTGLPLVLGAPQDFLGSPGRWMQWISTYGGTATAGPNFSYVLATRALKRSPETLDLSSLRIALNGAEPVDPASVRAFIEAGERHGLRPGAVFPAFGMAEVAIAGSFPEPMTGLDTDVVDAVALEQDHKAVPANPAHPDARELVTLGSPVKGLEFRIVEPATGAELGERQVGELQISGTSVTTGYFERPDATEELFDGAWMRTGDLAYMVDGKMVMCGRMKDVIIVGGRNVYPQDIERAVGTVDGVRAGNVIAFGLPGRAGKEAIGVVAETRLDATDELRHAINAQVVEAVGAPAKDVVLVKPSTLPKTSSGKLQRSLCRQQFVDGELTLA